VCAQVYIRASKVHIIASEVHIKDERIIIADKIDRRSPFVLHSIQRKKTSSNLDEK
jgi:hypothetical protein